jgi:hypothetical protein
MAEDNLFRDLRTFVCHVYLQDNFKITNSSDNLSSSPALAYLNDPEAVEFNEQHICMVLQPYDFSS